MLVENITWHQEIIKVREWISHVGPLTKVIPLKLFLDIVPSFSRILRALRGYFRGRSVYDSFRFKTKENLQRCGDVFFDILIGFDPRYVSKLTRSLNKRLMSPKQTITTEWTAEKWVDKRVKSKQTPKHKLAATEQTDGRNCWKTLSAQVVDSFSLPTLSEISQTEYVRQPQNWKMKL